MVPPRPPTQRHVAVGNLNLDISLSIPRLPGPEENVRAEDFWVGLGGAAANYAVAVARLGHRAALVARAGREARLLGLIDALEREGVYTGYIRESADPVGVVVVLMVKEQSSRSMITMRGANEGLDPAMVPEGAGDVLHFASVKPEVVVGAAGAAGYRLVSYDPGGEAFHDPEGVRRACGVVDVVLLNARELEAIAGGSGVEEARSLLSGRTSMVVVKYGSGGALLVERGGEIKAEPFRVERPVDVTGAGDAFDAAFNVWLLETGDPGLALRAAVAAGAAKTMKRGSSSMPTREEVLRLLAHGGPG